MRNRLVVVLGLVLALVLSGCGGGGSSTTGATSPGPAASSSGASPSASELGRRRTVRRRTPGRSPRPGSSPTSAGPCSCCNRYIVKPYRAGTFKKGASGRTVALIKAGLAAAATAKLVSNARENAKARPDPVQDHRRPAGPAHLLAQRRGRRAQVRLAGRRRDRRHQRAARLAPAEVGRGRCPCPGAAGAAAIERYRPGTNDKGNDGHRRGTTA